MSFPTREEHYVVAVARCRELAIGVAAAAALGGPAGRDLTASGAEAEYVARLADVLTEDVFARFGETCGADLRAARIFGERITATPVAAMSREEGIALLAQAQRDIVPGLARVSAAILERAARDQNDVLIGLQARIDRLEALFARLSKVGRTVHLIALNAVIEAARCGGQSGRIFTTIATEIRFLADEVARLVDLARGEIHDREDGPAAGQRRGP